MWFQPSSRRTHVHQRRLRVYAANHFLAVRTDALKNQPTAAKRYERMVRTRTGGSGSGSRHLSLSVQEREYDSTQCRVFAVWHSAYRGCGRVVGERRDDGWRSWVWAVDTADDVWSRGTAAADCAVLVTSASG